MTEDLPGKIFTVSRPEDFQTSALAIFRYQAGNNPVYSAYLDALGRSGIRPATANEIPFLPAEFFRNHKVITEDLPAGLVFESSGTEGMMPARHFVHSAALYERSFSKCFELFYGDPSDYVIAALLPSYTQRGNSSLVYMMNSLTGRSSGEGSGFYDGRLPELVKNLSEAKKRQEKIILAGVSFALLDLAEKYSPDLSGVIVTETGGMKGRRKEITRGELHEILKSKLNVEVIHSEYGMTELLSQAWSAGNGIFRCPPWMKIVIRDPQDPLTIFEKPGRTGGINVIDLANLYSCSFIATSDIGRLNEDGTFEVLGRFDNSDIRGCNLLFG
ncbi:MAG: acyltransferase [Bacteroidales bacterium]|nr:acyltransferase [Bacteroidales bacterium]